MVSRQVHLGGVGVEMGVEGRLGTELNTLEPIGMDRPHAGMGVVQPVSAVWSALYERVLTAHITPIRIITK